MRLTDEVAAKVLSGHPRVQQALADAHRHGRAAVDPALLALCEQRIGQLLGAIHPGDPDPPLGDSTLGDSTLGLAALAFVEQWVVDVAGISDEMVSVLAVQLGDDALMDFVHGVLVVEQRIRLGLAWQQLGLTA